MSEVLQRQFLFSRLVPKLHDYAFSLGYELTTGEAYRSDEQAAINALGENGRTRLVALLETTPEFHALALAVKNNGKANGILHSVHCDRLAQDMQMFKDGAWLTDEAPYRELGNFWRTLDPLCRWGGDFRDPDHFSIESPDGRK